LEIHTCFEPFRIKLYLAMYITGHVHMTHSSIALSGTHPLLDLDELLAVRGQPSHQRAVKRQTLSLVSLCRKQCGHLWRWGRVCICVCVGGCVNASLTSSSSLSSHCNHQPASLLVTQTPLLCIILWARVRSGGIVSVMHEGFSCCITMGNDIH